MAYLSNLPSPGIEPGPPGLAVRRANHYSTGVDNWHLYSKMEGQLKEEQFAFRKGKVSILYNLYSLVRVSVMDSKVASRLGAVVAAVMVFVHTERAALHAGSKEFEELQIFWLDPSLEVGDAGATVRISVMDSKVARRPGAVVATVLGSVVAAVMVFVHTERAALHPGSKEFEVLQTLWLDPSSEVGAAGAVQFANIKFNMETVCEAVRRRRLAAFAVLLALNAEETDQIKKSRMWSRKWLLRRNKGQDVLTMLFV
ncbi:hypothetical protein ANN_06407 [Periplaneta americana]|uniref:Uncharacterized protein n=1 Tax=Periplaneta americana TaxID=6978 RepID=A0ABQ8TDG2_PERAM|nr:hypothetical protein ANN_06407 [Periplaneta americana]